MERRKIRGRLASLIALVLLVALMSVPAYADNYTAIAGTTTSFNKYLVVDSDANIPAAEFSFTVAEGVAVTPTSADEVQVYAGPTPGNVVVGDAGTTTFTAGQATTPGTATDGIVNTTAKKYAKNTVTVDFTNVSFSNPGVFRYVITETAQADGSAYTNDSVTTRTLDVYVQDDNGTLAIQGYVMYNGTVTNAPKATATDPGETPNGAEPTGAVKSDKFINSYTTYDLTFGKQVTGNQGSKDKFFQFTVKLAGAEIGDANLYTVETTGYDLAPSKTASTSYTTLTQPVDADGDQNNGLQLTGATLKAGAVFYLKHGQYVKIDGIAKGATYEVTEVAEDYTSTGASDTRTVTFSTINATNTTSGTIDADKITGFVNEKGGVIPTGILLSATPWIILGVVVVAGIVFFAIRSKKKYEEE
ncbi:hypothetical protein SAMN04487934_102230 [Eubacterium ruminantium]|nr:hypothetical protein SAMN04487934_102230 [Eubacterium ruminantium]